MKPRWRTGACLLLCALLVWFLADAEQVRAAAAAGLALCGRVVIPALFPFMAASTMLVSMGFGEWASPRLSGLMSLYRLPGPAAVPLLLGLAHFAAVAVWMVRGVREAGEVSDREGLRMAEQAVRQACVSCYALEGAYPATYDDLKEQSGIAIDEVKYAVFYEIFASNIMPEITVVERRAAP